MRDEKANVDIVYFFLLSEFLPQASIAGDRERNRCAHFRQVPLSQQDRAAPEPWAHINFLKVTARAVQSPISRESSRASRTVTAAGVGGELAKCRLPAD